MMERRAEQQFARMWAARHMYENGRNAVRANVRLQRIEREREREGGR
jgi:hypothetical protein